MNRQKILNFIRRTWRQWRLTVLFIVFVIIPVKSSIADWNWVPTGSMNPTILEGDLVYVNKMAYSLRFPLTMYRLANWSVPKRGDIVIFFSPEDGTRLVKRVIGLPGDIIRMKNDILFLNGRPVEYTAIEPKYTENLCQKKRTKCIFATEKLKGSPHAVMGTPMVPAMRSFAPVVVPQEHYFVMGDNRDNSKDSRFFGCVEAKAIVGKAKGVIVSFDITDKYQPRLKRFFDPLK